MSILESKVIDILQLLRYNLTFIKQSLSKKMTENDLYEQS